MRDEDLAELDADLGDPPDDADLGDPPDDYDRTEAAYWDSVDRAIDDLKEEGWTSVDVPKLEERDAMMTACSSEIHDAMRSDPERWDRETVYIGPQETVDGPPLQLFNCAVCGSTICREDCQAA